MSEYTNVQTLCKDFTAWLCQSTQMSKLYVKISLLDYVRVHKCPNSMSRFHCLTMSEYTNVQTLCQDFTAWLCQSTQMSKLYVKISLLDYVRVHKCPNSMSRFHCLTMSEYTNVQTLCQDFTAWLCQSTCMSKLCKENSKKENHLWWDTFASSVEGGGGVSSPHLLHPPFHFGDKICKCSIRSLSKQKIVIIFPTSLQVFGRFVCLKGWNQYKKIWHVQCPWQTVTLATFYSAAWNYSNLKWYSTIIW